MKCIFNTLWWWNLNRGYDLREITQQKHLLIWSIIQETKQKKIIYYYSKLFYFKIAFYEYTYDLFIPDIYQHRMSLWRKSENNRNSRNFYVPCFMFDIQQLQILMTYKKIYIFIVFTNPTKKFRQFLQVVSQR